MVDVTDTVAIVVADTVAVAFAYGYSCGYWWSMKGLLLQQVYFFVPSIIYIGCVAIDIIFVACL